MLYVMRHWLNVDEDFMDGVRRIISASSGSLVLSIVNVEIVLALVLVPALSGVVDGAIESLQQCRGRNALTRWLSR